MPMKYCPNCGNRVQVFEEGVGLAGGALVERRKANSKKPRFRYARSNKINLKKMAVAFRKTPAGKKKRR